MADRKVRTFVDADVLMFAARGTAELHRSAMQILDDPDRSFVASDYLRLEVLPKPIYNKKTLEAEFYRAFFEAVEHWPPDDGEVVRRAYDHSVTHGLSAIDALHVSAAILCEADELVTAERRTTPLHRVTGIRIRTIRV